MTALGMRVLTIVTAVSAVGCGAADREVRSTAANVQDPSQAHQASDARVGAPEGSSSGIDGGALEDTARASSGRGPVPCGKSTCGPDEYCVIKCTCCGARIANPAQASASYSCLPLPAECASTLDGVCGGNRTQEIPCA